MNALRVLAAAAVVISFAPFAVFAEAPLGDANMAKANRAAARVVKERMKAERPDDVKILQTVDKADIIVVRGQYDRVEDVLTTLKIAHVVVSPGEVAGLTLNAKQLLIVNCPGNIGPPGIEKIRKFVNAGGFLYTTDWALTNVVVKGFPGFIAYNNTPTENDVVEVEARAQDNNLLKHLTLSKENPKWWLEASSYAVRVLDAEKVDVLISSREMLKKYGEAAIAVLFPYGDGKVLHIVSHFYLQQNQTRTVAEKKSGKKFIAENSTLSAAAKAAISKSTDFSDDTVAGDMSSAYSSQQMTTNLVIERKKDQGRVEGLYGKSYQPSTTAAPRKVKVLEQKGSDTKVRTMDGEEQWVPTATVK